MKAISTAALVAALASGGAAAQDGAPDASFGTGVFGPGRVVVPFNLGGDDADSAREVAVDAAGRVIVAGNVTTGTDDVIGVARVLPDGQLDTGFDGDGMAAIAIAGSDLWVDALALYADGRIVLAGHRRLAGNRDFLVARLRADGTLDPQFGVGGLRTIDFGLSSGAGDEALAVAIAADGDVLVAGIAGSAVSTRRMAVARLTPAGLPDASFSGDGRVDFAFDSTPANDFVHAIAERPDGRLLLAGSSNIAGDNDFALVQLSAGGVPDAAFGSYGPARSLIAFDLGGSNGDTAYDVRIDGDAIFVAGAAFSSAGAARFAVAKLTAAGALDASFFGGGRQTVDFAGDGAAYAPGTSLALQSDGRILIAGQASRPTVAFDYALARLLPDGQLDTSFGSNGRAFVGFDLGGGNTDNGHAMALAQGRIVLAGSVQRVFNGGADRDFGLARLMLDLLFADDFE